MDYREVAAKANQILDEERVNPTVRYAVNPGEATDQLSAAVAVFELQAIRTHGPRQVEENPRKWVFESTNYNLLRALLAQAPESLRTIVVNTTLSRMTIAPACAKAAGSNYPNWQNLSSELPLVAEFCVRAGFRHDFFRVLGESDPTAGHVMLLRQLGAMIALNFTVLTDEEYKYLDLSISLIRAASEKLHAHYKDAPRVFQDWPGVGAVNLRSLFHDMSQECTAIGEKVRKARYFYLKVSLLEGLNLETNQDKVAVQSYLRTLGFSDALAGCLDEADRLFHEGGNGFLLKASMGHLRSFLENLHKAALPAVQRKFGGTVPEKWGSGLVYLREKDVLSEAEEKFVAGLYGLISDEAVHPIISEREYARLARNVLIEYALLFLRKLEKRGLTLAR